MIQFDTENSTYQIDEARKRVRRMRGESPPVSFLGADGEWTPFRSFTPLVVGSRCAVFGDKLNAGFLTSPVVSIDDSMAEVLTEQNE